MNRDDKEIAVNYLELVAARARQIAYDLKNGRAYPGDVGSAVNECQELLNKVPKDTRL